MKNILTLLLVAVISFGCKTDNFTQPDKDTTPPNVSIISPANNGIVLDSALIAIYISDNIAVVKVEIYIDGNLINTRSTAPWQYKWNVDDLPPNTKHTILVKAYDGENNIGNSEIITITVHITPTSNGLVAYYPLNGNANDQSGHSYDGINYGSTSTTNRFGNSNMALSFNGGNYIEATVSLLPQGNSTRSVCCWTKTNQVFNNDAGAVYNWGKSGGINYQSQRFGYSIWHGKPYFVGEVNDCFGNKLMSDNNWHFSVITYSGSEIRIYIDGLLDTVQVKSLQTNGTTLRIGERVLGLGGEYYYGFIDDIRIYNRVLSDAEIQVLYHEDGW